MNTDAIVIGAGHNGLVSALLLARAGLRVRVLEGTDRVGGACVTEFPFAAAPGLGCSTGAYLLGLMPPELMATLGLDLPLRRRDPHYFLPTTDRRYLLFGSDRVELARQFRTFFSDEDLEADVAMNRELAQMRDDLAPAWLAPPLDLAATAERYIRPSLRSAFVALCRGSVAEYLDRFGFRSDLLKAMYAVTDGFSGLAGGYDSPGTGLNLLVHNMCRLPGSDGTWMIVEGGMGTVTGRLAELAVAAGVEIRTGARVDRIRSRDGAAVGVTLAGGEEIDAGLVFSNADPFTTERLAGTGAPVHEALRIDGSTLKVNLCLSGLPRFTCLPEDRGQFGPTIHLLPDEAVVLDTLGRAHAEMRSGALPEFPAVEWYFHSTVDPGLRDEAGRHSAALFVQWVPYELAEGTWAERIDGYVAHLLSICDRFAPGTSDLVEDVLALPPPAIEERFGIARGHIHHVDNSIGFADRPAYRTTIDGLYRCGAGCHPAGSVIGAAGHNAALAALSDLGIGPHRECATH